ncbi:MAG: aldose epimerase family protein [Brevinema sp.]
MPVPFGTLKDGRKVCAYTLSSSKIKVSVLDYGAIIRGLSFENTPVILGFNSLQEYIDDTSFQGAVAGRHAGRIENGHLHIDGHTYQLEQNNGSCHLHGGGEGFHQRIWDVTSYSETHITLEYKSPSGECGYPEDLHITLSYHLEDNNFIMKYTGVSSGKTICNPTNHTYFNLSGEPTNIEDHILRIDSDYIIALDDTMAPQSRMDVTGTPFDFRKPKAIGRDIGQNHPQLTLASGYDHPFALNQTQPQIYAYSPKSKISLTVSTDQPAVIFYAGNFLKDKFLFRQGFCLETQNFPNAVNQPSLANANTFTTPENPYQQTTCWSFNRE